MIYGFSLSSLHFRFIFLDFIDRNLVSVSLHLVKGDRPKSFKFMKLTLTTKTTKMAVLANKKNRELTID